MELEQLASCLEKLGNQTRLAIFRLLVRAGRKGLAVGEIQAQLGVPPSTLSHHILCLMSVGLVTQEREGRVLRCKPNYDLMNAITDALMAECCTGVFGRAEPARATSLKGGKRRRAAVDRAL